MSRWRARLAELRAAVAPPALVQNVQSVQKSLSVPTIEHFEQIEQSPKLASCVPGPGVWSEGEEERAAVIEHDGGARRAWAEALARLDSRRAPRDVPPGRWLRFIDDCARFLDGGWADRAASFGWGPLDLFGCDRERPFARVDHLGLLWLLAAPSSSFTAIGP